MTYRFVGHRLIDLLSIGRDTVEIVCPTCRIDRRYPIRELITMHGNVVLPHLLGLVTPACPRKERPDKLACSAIYKRPLTVEEEIAIKAGRVGVTELRRP